MSAILKKYDVVIVGTGTSAYYCASTLQKAAKANSNLTKSIAIVDARAYGGTCGLRGCQPKKFLVANVEAVAMAKHLVGKGINASPTTNWADVQKLKNDWLAGHSDEAEKGFADSGIHVFNGKAVFDAEDQLRVIANSATEEPAKSLKEDIILQAKEAIVLATGSESRLTKIPGYELLKTSDDFLDLPTLPRRILFIGGGFISFEFATVAALAGAEEVSIVHRSNEPLKQFDQDIVAVAMDATKAHGVDIVLNDSPVSIEKLDSGAFLVKMKSGKASEVDVVFECTGRTPNLSVIGADNKGGVTTTGQGVIVDAHLRSTSNPKVFAIGDVAVSGGPLLAPIGDSEGQLAADNILNPENPRSTDYRVVPSCVFTVPNIATVGMDERAATKAGKKFKVNKGNMNGWPSSKRIGEHHTAYKVLIDEENGQLLGAHLIRHNAAENINIFALAMQHNLPASSLDGRLPWAYPTYTSDLKYTVR